MKRISVDVSDFITCQAVLAALKVLRCKLDDVYAKDPDLLSMAVDALFAVRSILSDAIIMEMTDVHGYRIVHNSFTLMELYDQ